jgi:octaprenyl-diphosphate synthase
MIGMLNLDEPKLQLAQLLAEQLDEVALIFERQLASELSAVNALCTHIERYRGKMLRPTLVLVSGLASAPQRERSASTPINRRHLVLAAVVEMIHMATLVHDDVLDEAQVRRSAATLNHLHGNEAAVMLGDFLISNAFHLCSTLGDPAINLVLGSITNTVCTGELVQLHHRYDFEIAEATYFDIIRRKTASLIGGCCELGAMLAEAPLATSQSLKRFGETLGIAFQIQDDVLDLTGEETTVGKTLGRDVDKGKLTLPMIRHLDTLDAIERAVVLNTIKAGDADSLRTQLLASGAVESSRRAAEALVAEAKAELATIPNSPARELLDALADAVVNRQS